MNNTQTIGRYYMQKVEVKKLNKEDWETIGGL